MTRELKSNDCTGKCDWKPTEEVSDGLRIFACSGCGSEWTSELGWTPRNADGEVSPAVLAEKAAARPQTVMEAPVERALEGNGGNGVGGW
ncbi:hypothetical protein AAEX63_10255 [Luteococcus sp. H138]|uniref:hypothetical protein n=1 Tax=unclassified Luteococcus TaxID=2639923 RepID=UPI00313F108E